MSRREGTLYARLGLQLVHHHRAVMAGEEAMGVYAFLVMYSRLEQLDGFVPRVIAERCWSGDVKSNRRRLETLVSSGLIIERDDGWMVISFAEFNDTKAEIAESRAKVRERVTRYRRVTDANVPVYVYISDQISEEKKTSEVLEGGESERGPADEHPSGLHPVATPANDGELSKAARLAAREAQLRAVYCAGIAEGKGTPFLWQERRTPTGHDANQGKLNEAVRTFAKARDGTQLRGAKVDEWVRLAAADFAESVVKSGDDSKFWSYFQAPGFVRFLNKEAQLSEDLKHG
jgi:hypothetical protein